MAQCMPPADKTGERGAILVALVLVFLKGATQ